LENLIFEEEVLACIDQDYLINLIQVVLIELTTQNVTVDLVAELLNLL
jgi:hypothetical protein